MFKSSNINTEARNQKYYSTENFIETDESPNDVYIY